MNNYVDLIQAALFSGNNDMRVEAEKKLLDLTNTNTTEVLASSLEILDNTQNNSNLRVAAATLVKRAITVDQDQGYQLWVNLAIDIKEKIKEVLIKVLMTTDLTLKKGTAEVIATILAIELPRNEWNNLIPLLAENTQATDVEVRKSAIITLGYICEKLKNINYNLPDAVTETILVGICIGMAQKEENKEIKIAAISALDDSLAFMTRQFANDDHVRYVLDLLSCACTHPDLKIQKKAFECLVDFAKIHYERLGPYVRGLMDLTTTVLKDNNASEETAIVALEMWNTIAQEDKERREGTNEFGKTNINQRAANNYLCEVHFSLVPFLLRALLIKDDNKDEEELSISATAYRTLTSVCEAVGDGVLDNITSFVESMVISNAAEERAASLKAFTCMLEGPTLSKIKQLVSSALKTPVNLLFDEKAMVREAAAQCLCRIAELHPDCILTSSDPEIIPSLLKGVQSQRQSISQNICMAFYYLAEASPMLQNDRVAAVSWGMHIDNIIKELVQNAFRKDFGTNYHLIELSFLAVLTLVYNTDSQALCQKYLVDFMQLFKETVPQNDERSYNLQSSILATMQICLLRIGEKTSKELFNDVYTLIIEYFKHIQGITADGIFVISALSHACGSNFVGFLEQFWPYLQFAMTKLNEPETINSVFGAIQDISRATKDAFLPHVPECLEFLENCLGASLLSKELRLNVFICFGDISMAVKARILPFLEGILKYFSLAYEHGAELANSGAPDDMDYLEQLKEKLVEAMTCIVHAVNEFPDSLQILSPHLGMLFQFIKITCADNLNPTVEYLRNCVGLEVDIIEFYPSEARNLLDFPFLEHVLTHLKKYEKDIPQNKNMIEYATEKLSKYAN